MVRRIDALAVATGQQEGGDTSEIGRPDVEAGDVFVEITEKTQFPGFRFSRRVECGAWQRQKRAPGEKTALRRIKTWGFVIC